MNDPMTHLPYAPYLMYMIGRVTNVRYPKDVLHEPLRHLRDRAKRPPKGRKYVGSSSAAPRQDDLLVITLNFVRVRLCELEKFGCVLVMIFFAFYHLRTVYARLKTCVNVVLFLLY
jgi:hypothetical protein